MNEGKTSYEQELSQLEDLETFDPRAFQADEKVPIDVCSVVLSLALIYNDYKDILLAQALLDQVKPRDQSSKLSVRGAHAGIEVHHFRAHVAQMHALLEFVRESRSQFEHPFFHEVLRQLPRESREAWDAVVQVAAGATPKTELGLALLMVRNKVASHYDRKMVQRGYDRHFFGDHAQDSRAYVSRGDSMATSRFYFADAGAQGVVREIIGNDDYMEFMAQLAGILRPVNIALMHIVLMFIQRRGFAFRLER